MDDPILDNRTLAARLDGLADLTHWTMSTDAWNDGPSGLRTLLREAAQRLRCGDQGEPTAIADQRVTWSERPGAVAESAARVAGPAPGTPLALARTYAAAAAGHARDMHVPETEGRLARMVSNLAAAVAAFIAEQDTTNDLLAQHGPNAELALRLDTLERSQANTIQDMAGMDVLALRDRLRRADGYIDGLAERVCSLEDRNEHVARILAADGPESGVTR